MRSNSRPARPAQWRTYVLLAVLVFSVTGCGRQPEQQPVAAREKTAVIPYLNDMEGVNELITVSTQIGTSLLYFALFLPLLEEQDDFDQGPPTMKPRLAESYEFSEDRLHLTMQLRRDVTWSDGVPVTAEDVRWTWEAQTHPDIAWDLAYTKDRITNVEVLDPYRVRFHYDAPYATQLLDANNGVILPKHAWSEIPFERWREDPAWFFEHLVVSGPFTLEAWEPNQRIVLRRNESYYEPGLPKLDRAIFQVVTDSGNRLALIRSGQAHLVEAINPAEAEAIEKNPDLKLLAYNYRQFVFLCWNTRRELFADREIRQALTMAIDRQQVVDSIYRGYAEVVSSAYPSYSWAYNRDLEPWPHDPERARAILAEKGWKDTDGDGVLDRDGKAFRFEILTNSGNQIRLDTLVMLQEQLRRVGVDAQPRSIEFQAKTHRENAGDFDVTINGLGIDTSLDLSYLFQTGSQYNWAGYSNPEVDELIPKINLQPLQLDAKPLYDRLQVILHEDLPFTYVYQPRRLVAASQKLHHIDPNAITTYARLRYWELGEPD